MQGNNVELILPTRYCRKHSMSYSTSLHIASTKKRVYAFVIDDFVIAILLLIIFYEQLLIIASHLPTVITPESLDVFQNEMNHFSVNNLLLIISLKVLYHTFFIWQNGMTLGKYIMKIKAISLDTKENLTLLNAFLRAILRIVSEMVFYLGFLLAFFLPLNQTLHDKLSQCVIVDV